MSNLLCQESKFSYKLRIVLSKVVVIKKERIEPYRNTVHGYKIEKHDKSKKPFPVPQEAKVED
ncbi:MAG: hypothetical protein AMXMBFR16_12880 [Candidatus Uhrbacteria bacterium]